MAVCRYIVTCPKWPECRHGGFTARDTFLPGSHRASPGVFPSVHGVSGHTETGCIPHHGHGVVGTASAVLPLPAECTRDGAPVMIRQLRFGAGVLLLLLPLDYEAVSLLAVRGVLQVALLVSGITPE